MTLFEKLWEYSQSGALPMHMPGHKRNTGAFPWLRGMAERDITEIEGFDNLNDPEGLFADMEARAARLWGAGESVALVNGSTVGILASVLACLGDGGEILMSRSSHRSVYHAAELSGAVTRYLVPEPDPELGIPLSVTPTQVAAALERYPGVKLVCVTSPTYEGVISDIRGIAEVCHSRGVPLLTDCAHGAHLGLRGFPESPVRWADLTVQSLHKTLPALTQTAMLHINPALVDPETVRRYVGMLQSSSPSYLLSASVDACVDFMEREGDAAAGRWLHALEMFREGAGELRSVRLWRGGGGAFGIDPSKLLLFGDKSLPDGLRDFGIEPEYARGELTLCMTGMGDTPESLKRLLEALLELDGRLPKARGGFFARREPPEQAVALHKAAGLPGRLLPLDRALGRVSGEYAWVYPPGVPLVAPGEVVDDGVIEAIKSAKGAHFTRKHGNDLIFCVDLT